MAVIQQIGSYAGLAAVVGLAVLAGLYFSQARDVKRLREWAGRAPERAPVAYQPPYRAPAQPVRQQPPPRPPVPPGGSPAARPAPAQTAAAGATPAVAAGPVAATPAAARAAEDASALTQSTAARPAPSAARQTLPPRAAPPGLGGHFAREAELARAEEEAQRAAAGGPDQDEDEPGDEARSDEALDGAAAEDGHPEDGWTEGEEPESEGDDLGDEDDELDGEGDYDQESDPGANALPDPEDFHEGDHLVDDQGTDDRLVEGPGGGEQRTVAPPLRPPPPPITAARRPLPPRPAPPPRTGQAPLIPPYEQSRPDGGSWENRKLSPGKTALAVGGTVVVVAAAAFGVLQLTGKSDSAKKSDTPAAPAAGNQPAGQKKAPAAAAVDPRSVTVSVLNGTTVGGLAAQLGDKLERQGFQLGNVTNNTDQQRAESVVLFAPGAEKEAKEVGRRLKIDQREPIDPDSQTRAGDATVVVVTGGDLNK